MTDSANKPLDVVEDIFKKIVWDSLITAGQTALFADVPVLNIWPLRPILTYLMGMFSDRLFAVLKLSVDVEAITLLNEVHQVAYDRESVKLKVIAHNQGVDSVAFKEARDAAKAALAQYTQFGH